MEGVAASEIDGEARRALMPGSNSAPHSVAAGAASIYILQSARELIPREAGNRAKESPLHTSKILHYLDVTTMRSRYMAEPCQREQAAKQQCEDASACKYRSDLRLFRLDH